MPEALEKLVPTLKWAAGIIGALAASVTGYGVLGGPVPATRAWVDHRFEEERRLEDLREDIRLTEGLIAKTDDPELIEDLEGQLARLRARLDDQP